MKKIIEIAKLFAKWRVLLFLLTILLVPIAQSFIVFANFDGLRFLNIAKEGYGTPHTFYSYSLFPMYPLLIKFLSPLFGFLTSGLVVSHFFALASLFVFWHLARLDYSAKTVKKSIILLLCFPASFFLISVYSESLFLFLSLLMVYLLRKKYYLPSALVGMLATYTRSAGLFLWVILLIEYYQENKDSLANFLKPSAISLLLPPLGGLYYLNYLQINTSSFLNFLPTIPLKFVFLHQVIFRYFKMLIFVNHTSPLFYVILTESLIGFFAIYLLVISYSKMRRSYWFYFFLSFFIPTLWGTFSGISRFILVVFPIFFFLGEWLDNQHPYFQKLYYFISILLLIVNLGLYINGIFVG